MAKLHNATLFPMQGLRMIILQMISYLKMAKLMVAANICPLIPNSGDTVIYKYTVNSPKVYGLLALNSFLVFLIKNGLLSPLLWLPSATCTLISDLNVIF